MERKIGIIASIITIFVFITGVASIKDFVFEDKNTSTIIEEGDDEGSEEIPEEDGESLREVEETTKYLADLSPADGGDDFFLETQSIEDGAGNIYRTHLTTFLSEYPESDTIHSLTFGLGQKYTRFQGVAFVYNNAPKKSAFRLEILLDGNNIYTSDIVTKYDPCDIDVDITGGKVIQLNFCFEDGSGGMADGWYKQAPANIADARFIM